MGASQALKPFGIFFGLVGLVAPSRAGFIHLGYRRLEVYAVVGEPLLAEKDDQSDGSRRSDEPYQFRIPNSNGGATECKNSLTSKTQPAYILFLDTAKS